jgi:hypothetical protein
VLAAVFCSLLRFVSVFFLSPFLHTTASHLTPVNTALVVEARQHNSTAFWQMDVFYTLLADGCVLHTHGSISSHSLPTQTKLKGQSKWKSRVLIKNQAHQSSWYIVLLIPWCWMKHGSFCFLTFGSKSNFSAQHNYEHSQKQKLAALYMPMAK